MTAAWMSASVVIAILLAVAAALLTRVGALWRGIPLRWIPATAMLASLVVPVLWLRPASVALPGRSTSTALLRATGRGGDSRSVIGSSRVGSTVDGAITPAKSLRESLALPQLSTRAVSTSATRALRIAWLGLSSALLLMSGWAGVRLRRERTTWECRELDNTLVFISERFGPAIVGVSHPAIVLPRWVLGLEPSAQRAIVAHEAEHRAAHDPALLLAGLGALLVMPWNPGLWLSWRGLRRAIELDCDARVVARGMNDAEYAGVLLGAWKSAHGSWLPTIAFAERASGLGARVEHLMRPEPRRKIMKTFLGSTVAAGLLFIACAAPAPQLASSARAGSEPYPLVVVDGVPRPELPPLMRFTGTVSVETLTTPTYRIVYHGPQQMDTAVRKLYPSPDELSSMQEIDAPASVAHFGDAARYGVVLYYTKKYRDAGGAIIAPGEGFSASPKAEPPPSALEMNNRILAALFNGIALSPDKASQARAIIQTETANQGALRGPGLAIFPQVIALNAARDAQLRALLTSDADRARFDQRSREGRPCCTPSIEDDVKSEYNNIFGYPNERAEAAAHRPTLAVDKRERAQAIIRTNISDELALYARAPSAWTSNYDERVAMRMKRDADLRALLATDADREKYDKIVARLRDIVFKRG